MTRKVDLKLRCPGCGKAVKVHDYPGRWPEGVCWCGRPCMPPEREYTLTSIDMMTGEVVSALKFTA